MIRISLIIATFIFISFPLVSVVNSLEMDVKCTVYEDSDVKNANNVDVRTYVLGLKANSTYTAFVMPDHNPPVIVSAKTDQDGSLWTVAKIPNGEFSLLFKVNVYEGNGTVGRLVASGDDDAPCYGILPFNK